MFQIDYQSSTLRTGNFSGFPVRSSAVFWLFIGLPFFFYCSFNALRVVFFKSLVKTWFLTYVSIYFYSNVFYSEGVRCGFEFLCLGDRWRQNQTGFLFCTYLFVFENLFDPMTLSFVSYFLNLVTGKPTVTFPV